MAPKWYSHALQSARTICTVWHNCITHCGVTIYHSTYHTLQYVLITLIRVAANTAWLAVLLCCFSIPTCVTMQTLTCLTAANMDPCTNVNKCTGCNSQEGIYVNTGIWSICEHLLPCMYVIMHHLIMWVEFSNCWACTNSIHCASQAPHL